MRIKIRNDVAFVFHSESLGDLAVFPLTAGQMRNLTGRWACDLKEVDSREFVKFLIIISTCPSYAVTEGVKPDKFNFPEDSISKLSCNDVERFSELYAKHFIDKGLEITGHVGVGGESASSKQNVKYIKGQEETYAEYVHRVEVDKIKDLYESMSKISKSAGFDLASMDASWRASGQFSGDLKSMMDNSLSMGKHLREMIESSSRLTSPFMSRLNPGTPLIDAADIAKRNAEALQRPFEPLYEKLESLNSVTGQTGELLALMNETQTRIATELKSSSDDAAKFSKINIRLNIFIAFLGFLSLAVAGMSTYYTVHGQTEIDQNVALRNKAAELSVTKLSEANLLLNERVVDMTREISRLNSLIEIFARKVSGKSSIISNNEGDTNRDRKTEGRAQVLNRSNAKTPKKQSAISKDKGT